MRISKDGFQVGLISLPRIAFLLVALGMFWHLLYNSSDCTHRERIIGSDGAGYYAYLPALFIYHDMQFKFCQEGQQTKVGFPAADAMLFMNHTSDGKLINKYFIGTSVLEMPFFLVAYGTATMFGYHMNGYSFPFQMAVALAAIFYVLLGFLQLIKLMEQKKIPQYIQALVVLLLFFGTNLYHYTLVEPSMSHAFSFGMVALFINQANNVINEKNRWSVLWCIVALTMVILIRPVNGVVVFSVPFIAGSWEKLKNGFRFLFGNRGMLMGGAFFFALMIFTQLLVYKMSIGSWFADSYSGEHFDLLHPYPLKVLFSWRKGWFVYSPIMLLAMAGLFFLRSNFERFTFLAWFIINVWFISSWQTWMYGGCFGMRPMVESLPVMALPLAFFMIGTFRKWMVWISGTVLAGLLIVNLIQLYQYSMSIIAYDEMTCERYWKVFLKTNDAYRFLYDPGTIRAHTLPDYSKLTKVYKRTFENDTQDASVSFWAISNEKPFEGAQGVKLDTGQTTAGLCVSLKDAVPDSLLWSKTWIRVHAKVFLPEHNLHPRLVVSFRSDGREYASDGQIVALNVNEVGCWQDFVYNIKLPTPPGTNVDICMFLMHDDKSVMYGDNMEMEFWVEP